MTGSGFLILSPKDECRECRGCIRVCPVKAIRVRDRRSEVVPERCVKCGECVGACGAGGHAVRDDLPAVRKLLGSGRPVVALLATEWRAAAHPLTLADLEHALAEAGFAATETTLLGEEVVAAEYERLHAGADGSVVLRSTCPVAVEWVRRYHPALVGLLAPVLPPYQVQARLVRSLYPDDVAVVYVSPCYARKDDVSDPTLGAAVDVVIGFDELAELLTGPDSFRHARGSPTPGIWRPTLAKELSLTDGFPRTTLAARDMTARDVVTARGAPRISSVLGAIERGETGPLIVDLLYCDSCIDGPAIRSDLSGYARRRLFAAPERGAAPLSVSTGSRAVLEHLPPLELTRTFLPEPVASPCFTDAEIDACLAAGEFASRDEVLDCGACGYPTCVEHAVAVLAGDSAWDMCVPLERARLERDAEALKESARVDPLTGVWNRRGFTERLETEVARHQRYGSALTLLMIDLDGFKSVNDTYGHSTGDVLLRAVASAMRECVRETDVLSRYGGDEFALMLPGVGKTAGYAVAEKLRAAIAGTRVAAGPPGRRQAEVGITLSVGLAAAGPSAPDAASLFEAADRALYRAKEAGRDRVMIAAD